MTPASGYAIEISTGLSYTDAIDQATALLKDEGFGILTEIDVKETFKKKLDIEYKPFKILGACNPNFAHRSLGAVPTVSVFLPCNFVVWDEGSHRIVAAMEPLIMSSIIDNPELKQVGGEVSERIHRIMEKLSKMSPL
jgi:uncharacterized protein (DUF302 family)